jgi:adenosylcobinamide-phosphate synthase
MVSRPLGVAAGVVADRMLGEPPVAAHPVAGFGAVMRKVETHLYRDGRPAGAAHTAVGAAMAAAAGAALRSPAVAAYVAVAGRSLAQTALDIEATLERHDLAAARARLPALVGRDPSQLDEPEVARAVVESVAENTVDAVVAPALWAAVAGAPGVFVYRAVNTLDAMVGHRSLRYEQFGWASARLDDLAGLIPARVTAGLVAAVRPRSATHVARAVREDAPAHPSPNAGIAEAAFAAALGLRLGGTNRYGERVEHRPALGVGRTPAPGDIRAAVRLSRDVTGALVALLAMPSVLRWLWCHRAGRHRRACRRRAGRHG